MLSMLANRSSTAPPDQLALAADRLYEILITGGTFDAIYRHILAVPGKRLRTRLVLSCAQLLPSAATVARAMPSTWPV